MTAQSTDDEILRSIIEAVGADLQSATFNFTYSRTPDGLLTLTQADQSDIADTLAKTNAWLEQQRFTHIKQEQFRIRLETRTRCNMRVWLRGAERNIDQSPVAFLTVGRGGYAMGLWSPRRGYIYETEERFERGANSEMTVAHTRDVLIKFIAPSSLAQLGLELVSRVVVSAIPEIKDALFRVLREAPELRLAWIEGIRLNHTEYRGAAGDEPDYTAALALGALVETDSVHRISPIDLSITPQEELEQLSQSRTVIAQVQEEREGRKARLAIAAPLVVVAAFLLTTWFQYRAVDASLNIKIDSEQQVAEQLRQATSDYESSKKNFGRFKLLLDNVISLRERQPATHQLLRDLNSRWPRDASWYISEIDVKGAGVQIKGRARNEQAVTAFAKALEFSDGLFSNILTNNNVAGSSLAGPAASTAASSQSSDVIEFTVRANYSPMKTAGQVGAVTTQASTSATPSVSERGNANTDGIASNPGAHPERLQPIPSR